MKVILLWSLGSGLWVLVLGFWSLGSGLSKTSIHPKDGAALELLSFQVLTVVGVSQMGSWIMDPDGSHSSHRDVTCWVTCSSLLLI